MVTVISTGYNSPTRHLCKRSIKIQESVEVDHIYIEAADQKSYKGSGLNLWEAAKDLPPDRVVAWVDGDDWLARPDALKIISDHHNAGAWVTYGQFIRSDGYGGFAAPYPTQDYRNSSWLATHLKTFRAGLLQRINKDELLSFNVKGAPWDLIVMFACMEMAGPEKIKFIPDYLYVYHYPSSYEGNASPDDLSLLSALTLAARSRRPYDRIEEL